MDCCSSGAKKENNKNWIHWIAFGIIGLLLVILLLRGI